MHPSLIALIVVLILSLACSAGVVHPTNPPSVSEEALTAVAPTVVDVGRIEEYASGEPVHFTSQGFWLVRVGDDLILALSDRDTDPTYSRSQCRIVWRPDAVIDARYGWFRGKCSGSLFNVNGRIVSGQSRRSMDRYAVTVTGGAIVVDTMRLLQ